MAISDNAIILNYRWTGGKLAKNTRTICIVTSRLGACAGYLCNKLLRFFFSSSSLSLFGLVHLGRRLLGIDQIYLQINFSLSPFMSATKYIYQNILGEICCWSKPLDFHCVLCLLFFCLCCICVALLSLAICRMWLSFRLILAGVCLQTISFRHVIILCYMYSKSSFCNGMPRWRPFHHLASVRSRLVSFTLPLSLFASVFE